MTSGTGNHLMGFFYLLKENFKNRLFPSLITQRSFENFCYLSNCSLLQRWRFRRISSNVLRGIESGFAYTKLYGVVFQYIIHSGSLWHPRSSSMLKNKQIFSLIISKLMSAFFVWLYNLVYPTIISTNTSSKNNSRSLREVTILSSLISFWVFVALQR